MEALGWASPTKPPQGAKMSKDFRILIADDLEINRDLLEKILAGYGNFDFAENGQETLDRYKASCQNKTPYDLILLDILMPIMDGQQALKAIRAHEAQVGIPGNEQVKVIMVSTLGDWDNVLESYKEGGAEEYIVKPITKRKVLEVIDKAMGLVAD